MKEGDSFFFEDEKVILSAKNVSATFQWMKKDVFHFIHLLVLTEDVSMMIRKNRNHFAIFLTPRKGDKFENLKKRGQSVGGILFAEPHKEKRDSREICEQFVIPQLFSKQVSKEGRQIESSSASSHSSFSKISFPEGLFQREMDLINKTKSFIYF